MLAPDDKVFLLQIARKALTDYLKERRYPDLETDNPVLLEPRATFVTLREKATGELRGCRGETTARHPLIESVAYMAIASGVDDPRFPPVTLEEIPGLHIEINALTPLTPIRPEEIEIGRHGLMILLPPHAGLLLPEVAHRYQWDVDTFLRATCRKAGLPENAWKLPAAELYGFEAEVWGE